MHTATFFLLLTCVLFWSAVGSRLYLGAISTLGRTYQASVAAGIMPRSRRALYAVITVLLVAVIGAQALVSWVWGILLYSSLASLKVYPTLSLWGVALVALTLAHGAIEFVLAPLVAVIASRPAKPIFDRLCNALLYLGTIAIVSLPLLMHGSEGFTRYALR